jgi:hypothetical protein
MARCVSGRRAGPPEWLYGVDEYRQWEQSFSLFEVVDLIADATRCTSRDSDEFADCQDRLVRLTPWMRRNRFDVKAVNGRLAVLEVASCVSSSKSE